MEVKNEDFHFIAKNKENLSSIIVHNILFENPKHALEIS